MYCVWNSSSKVQDGPFTLDQLKELSSQFTNVEYVCRIGDTSWTTWEEARTTWPDLKPEPKPEPQPALIEEEADISLGKVEDNPPTSVDPLIGEKGPVRVQVEGLVSLTEVLSESQKQQKELLETVRVLVLNQAQAVQSVQRPVDQTQLWKFASAQLQRQQVSLDSLSQRVLEAQSELRQLLGQTTTAVEIAEIKRLSVQQLEQLKKLESSIKTEPALPHRNGAGTEERLLREWQHISSQMLAHRQADERRMEQWQNQMGALVENIISSLAELQSGIQDTMQSQGSGVTGTLTQVRATMDHLANVFREFRSQEPTTNAAGN